MLKEWLNDKYLDNKETAKLREIFLNNKPFPYIELVGLLKKEKIDPLIKAISKESFVQKESDLFKFSQTNDFISTENKELRKFRDFLASKEFISFMQKITDERLKTGKIDCNGSLYQDTDFLLPHDDQLEGRKIAFIYYLTTLYDKDGGELSLLDSKSVKVVNKIKPKLNSFAFFKVSDISFHQVEEVIGDKQRITINGWFHDK